MATLIVFLVAWRNFSQNIEACWSSENWATLVNTSFPHLPNNCVHHLGIKKFKAFVIFEVKENFFVENVDFIQMLLDNSRCINSDQHCF